MFLKLGLFGTFCFVMHLKSSASPLVFYMTIEVQRTATTKTNYRSMLLKPLGVLQFQQQNPKQTLSNQLLHNYKEFYHHRNQHLNRTFRSQKPHLSNGKERVDGDLKTTKSNCPFLPLLFHRRLAFQILTRRLSLVREFVFYIHVLYKWACMYLVCSYRTFLPHGVIMQLTVCGDVCSSPGIERPWL